MFHRLPGIDFAPSVHYWHAHLVTSEKGFLVHFVPSAKMSAMSGVEVVMALWMLRILILRETSNWTIEWSWTLLHTDPHQLKNVIDFGSAFSLFQYSLVKILTDPFSKDVPLTQSISSFVSSHFQLKCPWGRHWTLLAIYLSLITSLYCFRTHCFPNLLFTDGFTASAVKGLLNFVQYLLYKWSWICLSWHPVEGIQEKIWFFQGSIKNHVITINMLI